MLVAFVALLIFGPRKIPELARKAGKIMQELRQVSSEFRSTWEREVNLDEDEKNAFDFSEVKKAFDFNDEPSNPRTIAPPPIETAHESVENAPGSTKTDPKTEPAAAEVKSTSNAPEVREIDDPEKLEQLKSQISPKPEESNDKQNWL